MTFINNQLFVFLFLKCFIAWQLFLPTDRIAVSSVILQWPGQGHYRPNSNHCWTIRSRRQNCLKFSFEYLEMDTTNNDALWRPCDTGDHIELFDGSSKEAPTFGKFCRAADLVRHIESTGATIYACITTNGDHLTGSGFAANIEQRQCQKQNEKSSDSSLASNNEPIASPLLQRVHREIRYPVTQNTNYLPKTHRRWIVEANPNFCVEAKILMLDVEPDGNCDHNKGDDYLKFLGINGDSIEQLGKFCSIISEPISIKSNGNKMKIEFVSDSDRIVGKGLLLDTTTNVDCDDRKTNNGVNKSHLLSAGHQTTENPFQPTTFRAVMKLTTMTTQRERKRRPSTTTPPRLASTGGRYLCGRPKVPPHETGRHATFRRKRDLASTLDNDIVITGEDFSDESSDRLMASFDVDDGSGRIVGGSFSTPHSWPWQVSIFFWGSHICGGSLVSERIVVTAAHCFDGSNTAIDVLDYSLTAGKHFLTKPESDSEQKLTPEKIIRHPDYGKRTQYDSDIAVIVLKQPGAVFSDFVQPICLPESASNQPRDDFICYVTGHGKLNYSLPASSKVLRQAALPIVNNRKCVEMDDGLSSYVTENMICAGYEEGGHGSCQGDSGGPLACKIGSGGGSWVLSGIVSFARGCAEWNSPSVLVRVAKFIVWIKSFVDANS